MTAVVSGSVQFNFSPVVNVLPLGRDGKLLALAASTGKRSAILPDVPTMAEAGVSGYMFDPWFGILAPAKTPKATLSKLSGEIARVVAARTGIDAGLDHETVGNSRCEAEWEPSACAVTRPTASGDG